MRETIVLQTRDMATRPVSVTGPVFRGFVVHREYCNPAGFTDRWTISHRSGYNMGVELRRRKDAVKLAKRLAEYYDGNTSSDDLLEQFRLRGEKPTVRSLAETVESEGSTIEASPLPR